MATIEFEAWLGQAPIEIAAPIHQNTATTLNFTVLDEDRNAVDLTGYAAKFVAKFVNDNSQAIAKQCAISTEGSGSDTCQAVLTHEHLETAGECYGSLNLYAGGDLNGPCTDRVLFRFEIQEAIE